jgi:alcohol dehydrogenase class IV
MINAFQISKIPRIIFRNGGLSLLPSLAESYGKNIAIVTGSKSFEESSGGSKLFNEFRSKNIRYFHVRISGEPSPEMVDKAVAELKDNNIDLVISIGGGSAIDAGKSVSAMIPVEGSLFDYLEDVGNIEHRGTKIPFIAVPTTSGTGSEATKNAVISRIGENGFKKSLRHDNFVPDVALLDPELTKNCPPDITAASGMDCFTQLTEAYVSTKANPFTDALAIKGIIGVKDCLLRAYKNGTDIEARAGMSFAALASGICLANAGLGVVHGFASSIGGFFELPHGFVCGTLMAVSNEVTVNKLRKTGSNPGALKKYAGLGRIFLGDEGQNDDYFISGFIDSLYEMTDELNLPGLKSAGITESRLTEICASTGCKNNPVDLSQEELYSILAMRLT